MGRGVTWDSLPLGNVLRSEELVFVIGIGVLSFFTLEYYDREKEISPYFPGRIITKIK